MKGHVIRTCPRTRARRVPPRAGLAVTFQVGKRPRTKLGPVSARYGVVVGRHPYSPVELVSDDEGDPEDCVPPDRALGYMEARAKRREAQFELDKQSLRVIDRAGEAPADPAPAKRRLSDAERGLQHARAALTSRDATETVLDVLRREWPALPAMRRSELRAKRARMPRGHVSSADGRLLRIAPGWYVARDNVHNAADVHRVIRYVESRYPEDWLRTALRKTYVESQAAPGVVGAETLQNLPLGTHMRAALLAAYLRNARPRRASFARTASALGLPIPAQRTLWDSMRA